MALLNQCTALALLASLPFVACGASSDEGSTVADGEALTAGDPNDINIGFNGGADQFGYFEDFFAASSIRPGPRLCHAYVVWNVAEQPAGMGDAHSPPGSRAALEYWLQQAQGRCDEALVSFQAHAEGEPPRESEFTHAFKAFVTTPWSEETGFTGSFAFTPWNEPNNGGAGGDGLGKPIEPELAAAYYLSAARECAGHGCKVAAGDFASNGGMWNDFEWNCANDTVEPASLCKTPSPFNKNGRPASYLDRYKNFIADNAVNFGLGHNFRPKYFAFHGWHDINEYMHADNHCGSYADCATRRVLKSFGGSWGGVVLWDTEVGIDQDSTPIPDAEQACGAAFLIRVTAMSRRITRIYYTRLHNGSGELLHGHTPRLALGVLAHRETSISNGHCK